MEAGVGISAASATHMAGGRLAGKVSLVTGAGAGLGGAIAQAMACKGGRRVVCDIDEAAPAGT